MQEQRDCLAFGFPVQLPGNGRPRWLRRKPGGTTATGLAGHWLTGDADVLPFLADYFAEPSSLAASHLDDVWAAAGHRRYAYRWRLGRIDPEGSEAPRLRIALACWKRLPGILRFTVESAQRGRPRPALARRAMDEVRQVTNDLPAHEELP